MSTSTLGGFEREERKILYDEYLFQRRVLFVITISIVFAAFIWTIAICTDHWIVVTGDEPIFIPISGRFFVSSHTGLWRLCRYALTPILLLNSTIPQMLTNLIKTNPTEIERLKKDIANEAYIEEYQALNVPFANVTDITDNHFRQALFAHWVRGTADFVKFKAKYKALSNASNAGAGAAAASAAAVSNSRSRKNIRYVIASENLVEIKETFGFNPIPVQLNGTEHAMVMVPPNLQSALFNEWPQKQRVIYLLGKFAKDMDLTTHIIQPDGMQWELRPPDPPAKGHQNAGFRYEKYENCKYHNFFPLLNETEYDPSIDEVLLGSNDIRDESILKNHPREWENVQDLLRTQASFACMCLLIMTMAFVFSMYTFLNPRYMFKRLAAGVHFISASICFVVLHIVSMAVQYEKQHMEYLFPPGAEYYNGYGVYMAWAVFIVNASACFLFLWYSKKKKGNKAPNEELAMADEPIGLGR